MDGVLIIDKPQGLTSHDVVAVARRCLKEKRIGHTGTLDPLATGVLPLACGKATRLVRFLTASDKQYDATIRFGVTTDSYDVTGRELTRTIRQPTRQQLEGAVAELTGEYDQTPPAVSAKKVGGRRAYDFARHDEPVALAPVRVRVSDARITAFSGDRASISLTCSAGFYVRSFAQTLGELVGTGAALEELRRTRSGDFSLETAVTLDALQDEDADAGRDWLLPMNRLLTTMPAAHLTDEGRLRVAVGRQLERLHTSSGVPSGPWIRLIDREGDLVAIAQPGDVTGSLHPAVVLI
jgi:tRNA pseudouridine55 synthase